MAAFQVYRLLSIVLALVSSIVVLCLDAYIVHNFGLDINFLEANQRITVQHLGAPVWSQVGVAISALSILLLSGLLLNTVLRRKGPTASIAFELAVVGVIWVACIVAAASTTITPSEAPVQSCGQWLPAYEFWVTWGMPAATCDIFKTSEAFSTLVWIVALVHWLVLLALSVRAHVRGDRTVWTTQTPTSVDFSRRGRDSRFGGAGGGRGAATVAATSRARARAESFFASSAPENKTDPNVFGIQLQRTTTAQSDATQKGGFGHHHQEVEEEEEDAMRDDYKLPV